MHATENLKEADRIMTVCNSCRYCEGLCAVFPAMELRRAFTDGDLNYLANLCHACGACYDACQFSPPHEFNVNVPQVLAKVRADSYRSYAWPRMLQPLFDRSGLVIALAIAFGVAGFILAFAVAHDPAVLFGTGGNFYAVMPHNIMAGIFMALTAYVLLAFWNGFRNFWKDAGDGQISLGHNDSLWAAFRDAATLRYLDGGGDGCNDAAVPRDRRRLFHHFTFYGFLACFAATLSGTVMHYAFGRPAPYDWIQLPKLLGIPGGIALTVGTVGLLYHKLWRDRRQFDKARLGMDTGFISVLGLTGFSGLLLAALRGSPAMSFLLAFHLGTVFALYATMPYSKFVHGIYRVGALVRFAFETRHAARSE